MRRRAFDLLMTGMGLALTLLLLIAGGLLITAHNFTNNQIRDQLADQDIYFPKKGDPAYQDDRIAPHIEQWAGEQLLTGEQAGAYANHYIKVHLDDATGGRSYSELSTASRANPADTQLAGLVQLAFRGETLRGLLLNAYAFGKMAQIMLIAGIVSLVGAAILLVLSVLGLMHVRKVSPEAEILTGRQATAATGGTTTGTTGPTPTPPPGPATA